MTPTDSSHAVTPQPWLDELLAASVEGVALFDPQGRVVRHNALFRVLLGRADCAGAPVDALFGPGAFPLALAAARHRGWWQGPLRVGERDLDVRLRIAPDGRGALLCHDVSRQVELDRRAESLQAMIDEHADRAASAKELLFEQSERLTTLYQISVDALQSATLVDTANRICASLLDDLGAGSVGIWLFDREQQLLRRIAASGELALALPETFSRAAAPVVDQVLRQGVAAPGRPDGILAGLALFPLPGREHPLGVLAIDHAPDLDRVQVYAPHIATAINNAIMADELARANNQLRVIDHQKSDFLNVVAHDLRTPLTCIRTYTDLLRMYVDEPPETYAEFLQIIGEETERLGELLDNFLDLARIESRTIQYELEPVKLDEIIAHFAHVYLAKAASEAVLLTTRVPPDLPLVLGDRRRIEQVFSNLLSNAFKFTPRGGNVAIGARPDAGGVLITVDDTGPGVPEEDRLRIFERFRQARNTDRSGGGTGLGLSIAQAIVLHHGGRIWCADAPAGGARFGFWLPLEPPAEAKVRGGDQTAPGVI